MRGKRFSLTASISAVGNEVLKAAASGVRIFVCSGTFCVSSHADTGLLSLDDGTDKKIGPFVCKDGNGSVFPFDFGEEGYDWGINKPLRLVNATANVSGSVTLTGYTVGNS